MNVQHIAGARLRLQHRYCSIFLGLCVSLCLHELRC